MTCGHLGMEPHTSFLPTTATITSSQSDELTQHCSPVLTNHAEGMKGFTLFCGFSYFLPHMSEWAYTKTFQIKTSDTISGMRTARNSRLCLDLYYEIVESLLRHGICC